MSQIIKPEEDLHERLVEYFEEQFSNSRVHRDYIDRVTHAKQPLLEILGLPSIDSGILVTQDLAEPNHDIRVVFTNVACAIVRYEAQPKAFRWLNKIYDGDRSREYDYAMNYHPNDGDYGCHMHPKIVMDWGAMTYTYEKKQYNFLRKLRGSHPTIQRNFVWQFLANTNTPLPRGADPAALFDSYDHMALYLKEDGMVNFDKFWPRVGESIKAKARKFLLTCDPVMLLGQSVGNFSSCHAPDGCHRFGPFAYAADSRTIGLFEVRADLVDPDMIFTPQRSNQGRALFYIAEPDQPFYIQTRQYGSLNSLNLKFARDIVGKGLREVNGLLPAKWCTVDSGNVSIWAPDCVYIDYPSAGQAYALDGFKAIDVRIADALCPQCLSRFNDKGGCCITKYEYHCDACGDGLDEDDGYHADDDTYCQSCYNDRYSSCDSCSDSVYRDNQYHTRDGYILCEHCMSNNAESCEHCGETWYYGDRAELRTVHVGTYTEEWCRTCRRQDATQCSDCEDTFEDDQIEDGLCADCAEAQEEEEVHEEDQ